VKRLYLSHLHAALWAGLTLRSNGLLGAAEPRRVGASEFPAKGKR